MKSDAQAKRDELLKLAQKHGKEANKEAKEYISWIDARLREYLRSSGMPLEAIPKKRDQLLRQMRARYTGHRGIFSYIKDGVRQAYFGVQDILGSGQQTAAHASISASGAASQASASAASATARVKDEF
jgi:hypothetical protein